MLCGITHLLSPIASRLSLSFFSFLSLSLYTSLAPYDLTLRVYLWETHTLSETHTFWETSLRISQRHHFASLSIYICKCVVFCWCTVWCSPDVWVHCNTLQYILVCLFVYLCVGTCVLLCIYVHHVCMMHLRASRVYGLVTATCMGALQHTVVHVVTRNSI